MYNGCIAEVEMASYGGLQPSGKAEVREIRCIEVLTRRKKGYTFDQIGRELNLSVSEAHKLYTQSLKEAQELRAATAPHQLEETIQGFEQLEEMILTRGRVNLEAQIKRAHLHLATARTGDAKSPVSGRTAIEWEIEVARLETLAETTFGMENEDIDRLAKLRDRKAQYLGVEPAKKLEVEHTIVVQANEAQARLRAKLNMIMTPVEPVPEEVIEDAEVAEEEAS
jgi:hypothetical protein